MNRQKYLTRISELLSRFNAEVENLGGQNLYDINIHAENVLVPLLNEVYGLSLVNANLKDKNTAAVDLIDSQNRVCIQVTSIGTGEKVKHTLKQFKKNNLESHYDTLFIYIITKKQNSYSEGPFQSLLEGVIEFDSSDHILDNKMLFAEINSWYSLPKIKSVLEILEQ